MFATEINRYRHTMNLCMSGWCTKSFKEWVAPAINFNTFKTSVIYLSLFINIVYYMPHAEWSLKGVGLEFLKVLLMWHLSAGCARFETIVICIIFKAMNDNASFSFSTGSVCVVNARRYQNYRTLRSSFVRWMISLLTGTYIRWATNNPWIVWR